MVVPLVTQSCLSCESGAKGGATPWTLPLPTVGSEMAKLLINVVVIARHPSTGKAETPELSHISPAA